MIGLLLIHGGVSVLLAMAAGWMNSGRPSLRAGALELATALLIPGAGAAAVALQLLLQAAFQTTVKPADPSRMFEDPPSGPPAPLDPVDSLRAGLSVEPLDSMLDSREEKALDLCLRRLAGRGTPAALRTLLLALGSPRQEVRVRVRILLARLEDRMVRDARDSSATGERVRASRTLALIAPDGASARQHLERAAQDLRRELRVRFDPGVSTELARVLLEKGDLPEARDVLTDHIQRRPLDPEGYVLRMEAAFRLGDRQGVRQDATALSLLDSPYREAAQKWSR